VSVTEFMIAGTGCNSFLALNNAPEEKERIEIEILYLRKKPAAAETV
jgi:hypothetical protein